MNIKSLAAILREAAAIIHAIPCGGQPDNMRQPIVDELEGFASWVESDFVSRADYDDLLSQLEAVGAGGVKGRLMPGAVSAEPVSQYFSRVDGCQAPKATDTQCICWHDKGTGPYPDARVGDIYNGVTLTWRAKQTAPVAAQVQPQSSRPGAAPRNSEILDLATSEGMTAKDGVYCGSAATILCFAGALTRGAALAQQDADRYRALASHVFEMKVTHDQDSANRIRRIRLDIRKSTQSNKRLVDDTVDNFIENLEVETRNRALPENQGVTEKPYPGHPRPSV